MASDKHHNDKRFSATTPTKRLMKLAGMSASIAGSMAKNRIKSALGTLSDEDRLREREQMLIQVGEQIANTLGEMKGAVMKVGQIASQFKDVFPHEIQQALAKLQKASPPMPFHVIEQQIINELGKKPGELFAEFDPEPCAAASIGQVHRARTHDGFDVVMKVQYPGVDECVESDLKHLRMALKMAGVLKIDKDMLDSIFGEIRRSLHQELDYVQEAENARLFAEFHARDAKIIVPKVFNEYTSTRVLTLAYEPGDHVDSITPERYSQGIINELGERVFTAISDQIYVLNMVHCDPHPGNFAFRPDGSVVIYDYGCVKKVKPEIADTFRESTRAALAQDYAALEQALIDMGVRNTEAMPHISGDFYKPWRDLILRAFDDQPFDFATARLHEDVVKQVRRSLKYWEAFKASPDTMLVDRAIGGHYWTMKQLGVKAAFRPLLEKAVLGSSAAA